jgi:uncharacterized protein (DUF2267 family)
MSIDSDQFLTIVQEAAGISREEAERATRATLEVLGERIDAGEARQLAAELPDAIAPWVHTDSPAQAFGLEEFVRRVAEREGADPDLADDHVAAVFSALRRAVSRDELADVAAELPREFAPLVGAPAAG